MGPTIKAWLAGEKKLINYDLLSKSGLNVKLIILGIVGVFFLIMGAHLDFFPKAEEKKPIQSEAPKISRTNASYEEELGNKLANILSQIRGAGSVSVNITLEHGLSSDHAKNITKETKTTEEKDASGGVRTTTETKESQQLLFSKDNGMDRPVMVTEYKPVIKGVVVVAEGAADSNVKANLTRAVEAGLGLPAYKIMVLSQRK